MMALIHYVGCIRLYSLCRCCASVDCWSPGHIVLLFCSPTGTISSKFLQAQLAFLHHTQDVRGVDDARCLSNLVWSLVKLDLSSDAASLSNELALNVAPFVCRCLDDCSPQVCYYAGLMYGSTLQACHVWYLAVQWIFNQ